MVILRYRKRGDKMYKSTTLRYATYGEIASFLGVSRQAVANKMHGKSQFTLDEVLKLYDVYGVTIWELNEIVEEKTKIYQNKKERGLWHNQK